jgi:hypothetical protein
MSTRLEELPGLGSCYLTYLALPTHLRRTVSHVRHGQG